MHTIVNKPTGGLTDQSRGPAAGSGELLAPAGSIESFHAALEGGADAVYLGLTGFNARLRARNFTLKTLAYVVPYAHKHNVKVYVALNTLVKQAELEQVVHTLHALGQIGVDGLIVADFGLIDIARNFFPGLRLHGSTQLAVHTSAGVRAAVRLGLRRIILARELTMDELREIGAAATIEIEVFIHGALCYSVSGLCLASSFLGGNSGNRGRCTQVCRRKFTAGAGAGAGYYFSPRDLCAVGFLPSLRECGITSFKIEGRMKNAAYVYAVVDACRRALDGKITLHRAQELLAQDLGRAKTVFFPGGLRQQGFIDAAVQSGIGSFIGTVLRSDKGSILVNSADTIQPGDRIRVQPAKGFEGTSAEIVSISGEGNANRLQLKRPLHCMAGDGVFLIGRHGDDARFDCRGVEGVEPVRFRDRCPDAQKILSHYNAAVPAPASRDTLWVRIDSAAWLDHLSATPCQRLLFAGDREEGERLLADDARLRVWKSRLLVALPPFIPENEIKAWRKLLNRFRKVGVSRGVCSNIGHAEIFGPGFACIADAPLWCLNRAAQAALRQAGFGKFIYSWEDDYLNIKAAASPEGMVCLFSRVPLFVSRIRPAVRLGMDFSDPHGNRFVATSAHGLYYLIAEKPLCLTHAKKKLSPLGIHNFLLDLSFCEVDPGWLGRLIECYKTGTRMPGSSVFNFKAGLR